MAQQISLFDKLTKKFQEQQQHLPKGNRFQYSESNTNLKYVYQQEQTKQSEQPKKLEESSQKPVKSDQFKCSEQPDLLHGCNKDSQQIPSKQSHAVFQQYNQGIMFGVASKLNKNLQTNLERLFIEISNIENQYYENLGTLQKLIKDEKQQNHPGYLINQCLVSMSSLNQLIDKNINTIQHENRIQPVIKFKQGEKKIKMQQFNELQSSYLQLKDQYKIAYEYKRYEFMQDDDYCFQAIRAFDQSPDNQMLICSQYKTITIWNITKECIVNKIKYLRTVTALKCCDYSNDFFVGDQKGCIAIFDALCSRSKKLFKVHESTVCQIIIKFKNYIYTSSTDGTLKLSDLTNDSFVFVIDTKTNYFNGFDYSFKENFIIALCDKNISIFDSYNGDQISILDMEIQEKEFINIQLSEGNNQALVHVFSQNKIILINIDVNKKQIKVRKQMILETKCLRISWCFNDQAFAYLIEGHLLVRYIGNISYPRIFTNEIVYEHHMHHEPQINKMNPNLEELILTVHSFLCLYKRKPRKMNYYY